MAGEEMRMTVARNIRDRIDQLGISKKELAEKLGVSSTIVSAWTIGQKIPRSDKIEKMCTIFGCAPADLMLDATLISRNTQHRTIPLYGEISAGAGFFSESNIERYIAVDSAVKGDFAVRVRGSSMTGANIFDGDVAILSKQFRFAEGAIYAVWQTGENVSYLKRVYLNRNRYMLISENPEFSPIIVENNEAVILGALCGVYHPL